MDSTAFARIPTTVYADLLTRDRIMDYRIHGLWQPIPRVAGPAYPVSCPAGAGLMLQIALHRAPSGSVIVCASGDCNWAIAGGNGCAWAQRRGVAGLVVDGLIRDIGEVREIGFPVFGRGVIPIPGNRMAAGLIDVPVLCGGVIVAPGDMVVADEEGIVVLPSAEAEAIGMRARERADREAGLTLDEWGRNSKARIDEMATKLGL